MMLKGLCSSEFRTKTRHLSPSYHQNTVQKLRFSTVKSNCRVNRLGNDYGQLSCRLAESSMRRPHSPRRDRSPQLFDTLGHLTPTRSALLDRHGPAECPRDARGRARCRDARVASVFSVLLSVNGHANSAFHSSSGNKQADCTCCSRPGTQAQRPAQEEEDPHILASKGESWNSGGGAANQQTRPS
jgi:hypothetical protein